MRASATRLAGLCGVADRGLWRAYGSRGRTDERADLSQSCVDRGSSVRIRDAGRRQHSGSDRGPVAPTATGVPAAQALIEASLGNLSKTLHPYPDSASYTQPWIDAAALIWGGADGGGALLAFDWDTLDYRPRWRPRCRPSRPTAKRSPSPCATI